MTSNIQRELYLDLLLKSLSNCIYGPAPVDAWKDGLFRGDAPIGRDRNSPAHTMVGLLRLRNVLELTQRVIDLEIPGNLIETGVWRGGCCIMMRGVLAANSVTDRLVYVADSFSGLPPPKPNLYPMDEGSTFHLVPELVVPLEEVRANFARYSLLDDQVVFLKGFFSDTLPLLSENQFSVIRLDGDMYESTMVALNCLYPKLSLGGFCIVDDYGAVPECRAAVQDYRDQMSISEPLIDIDWTGVWWQKLR